MVINIARPRQPTDLVVLKGKKHLTKDEIKSRKSNEVKVKSDKVKAPSYLAKIEKKEFNKIAKELIEIGIMSNLDVDSLSFFIKTRKEYLKITKEVDDRAPTKVVKVLDYDDEGILIGDHEEVILDEDYETLLKMQLRVLDTCRKCASDLGLSITSRCRLVVPQEDDDKPENKFSRFM
ncbi:phage terminase small subunit P27 family [uncultured Clostridium sp.]|uniref:phage terminase small subunit P27 family n=1 Tax=uncultured Clostridium sp. TaxID=59620 RepID=UPI00345B9C1B